MYYQHSFTSALQKLDSTKEGLTSEAITLLQQTIGFNELPVKKRSLLKLFLTQFNNVLVYILLGALALSLAAPALEGHAGDVSHYIDAAVILFILVLNACFGFFQEFKAEEAIKMLQQLTAPQVHVRRSGVEQIIPAREVVPGDIVLLEAGDRISADGRLISTSHLQVNESSLTGESEPVHKIVDAIDGEYGIADQDNMVFSGTLVSAGAGEYVVTATGIQTEIGKIANLVANTTIPETPLQARLRVLGTRLGILVLFLCIIVIGVGILQQKPWLEILLIAVSLAVSAVPEGLPAVVTICFALGVKRMVQKNALVRRLDSLETLGSITVICSDKTGTITENKMKVVNHWLYKNATTEELALIGASCNRASLPNIGDPTELGLLFFAKDTHITPVDFDEEEIPFNSTDKFMQTRHGDVSYLKGAPEKIMELCSLVGNTEITDANLTFAKQGLRVLACAKKQGDTYTFVGLVALQDPPRASAKQAIAQAASAGIRSIMITGDNITTAAAIAKQVGIKGDALEGKDLDNLSKQQLQEIVKTTSVFARVSPENKLQILHALQANNEVVAMSGDGVNDAPALKGAHVGVAMGKVGTQVAREASSMVLADDHFSTIVAAIAEGRRIYDNIKKFVLFLLRTNFDELLFIIAAIVLHMPLPYLPLHILWINLVTDGLPALALGVEKAEPDTMQRPPRPVNEGILHGEWGRLSIGAIGGFLASFLLYTYLYLNQTPLDKMRSVVLTMAICFELLLVHTVRSRKPLYQIGFFSNKWLLWATLIPFCIHLLLLYTPAVHIFKLAPLTLQDWSLVLGVAISGFVLFEGIKFIPTKRKQ